jgi:23S rRNA pseudouridine955/2504/2580 synthase
VFQLYWTLFFVSILLNFAMKGAGNTRYNLHQRHIHNKLNKLKKAAALERLGWTWANLPSSEIHKRSSGSIARGNKEGQTLHLDDTRTDRRGLRVDDDDQGQRLDNYLARRLPEFPKSYIFKIVRSGEVRVNGARVAPEYRLKPGDQLRLPPKAEHAIAGTLTPSKVSTPGASQGSQGALTSSQFADPAPKGAVGDTSYQVTNASSKSSLMRSQAAAICRRMVVIYEDESLLVVNKPFGLAVHGGSGVNLGTIEALRLARPELKFLELAHRLDKETSGLLIVAKKRLALVSLQEQFRSRVTSKTYQALVFGRVPRREKTIRLALSRDPETSTGDRRVRPDPNGQEAISIVKGLAHANFGSGHPISRVSVAIETGRTHQIRVHLSSSGFAILGDAKYGDFTRNRELQQAGFKRMYLHAWQLSFRHPVTAATMRLAADLPEDFLRLVPEDGGKLGHQAEHEIPS